MHNLAWLLLKSSVPTLLTASLNYSIRYKLLKNTGKTIQIAVKRLLSALNRTLVQSALVVD